MNAKRGAIVAALFVAIGAACADLGGLSAPADAGAGSDAALDGAMPDAVPPPPSPPDDDGGDVDVTRVDAGPDADCCDCDDDGYQSARAGCDAGPDAADCDDLDPAIHPNQIFVGVPWDDASTHVPAGDWDCNGVVRKQFAHDVGACTALPLGGCSGEGFVGDPSCGETGTYETCTATGLSCTATNSTKRQRCK